MSASPHRSAIRASLFAGALLLTLTRGAGALPATLPGLASAQSCQEWEVIGASQNYYLGQAVAGAGDVNGDGYADVIVGVPGHDRVQRDEGIVYLYLGSPSGPGTTPSWEEESNIVDAFFGMTVSSAGDVNNDGFDDIIVAAPSFTNGEVEEGRVSLFLGSASGPVTPAIWNVQSNQVEASLGSSLSCAGDVNGDGFDDLILGASRYDAGEVDEGRAYVYHGSPNGGVRRTPKWTAESNQASAYFGSSVSGAGDVNGDGYDDVIVGTAWYDNPNATEGRAFVYHGSPTGLSPTSAWEAWSAEAGDQFGYSVSGAGDVNGDGFSDVIVGARGFENGEFSEGIVYVYHGSATGLSTTPDWSFESNDEWSEFGSSVSAAGDVNADGFSDVVVGAPGYAGWNGAARVFHGSAAGLSSTANWFATGEFSVYFFGIAVSGAGDVNGDGHDDVIVGETGYATNNGRASLHRGHPAGVGVSTAFVTARNAGANPASYTASPPTLGQNFVAEVNLNTTGHSHAEVLGFIASSPPTTLPGGQVLLVTGARVMRLPLTPGPVAGWSMLLPIDPTLCGLTVYTQAVHLFGVTPFALSNAQDLLIGY